ncbi:ribosome recycling factor domain-containing protein [Mrakia frigida]|uniref:ribosome-recycling factor n=1 Tax=Mrakia frigida TaxID=29902 RepID=UPI003FCC0F48
MSSIPRTLLRSSFPSRALASSSFPSSSFLRPTSLLQASSTASSSRLISTTPQLLAAGQGSKEIKSKKKSKGSMKYEAKVKGGKKGALEEEEEEEDEDSGIPHSNKNSRGRGVSEDINGHIDAEVEKAQDKMQKVVVWFTEKCEETISRGRGKVNGSALDQVKIVLPKTAEVPGSEVPLNAIATVSTKANVLTINVFDESHTKAVEKSIFAANIPGMSPVKFDARTIRITVPRPSGKDRLGFLKAFLTLGEQAKTNVRLARTAGLKTLGKGEGISEMQAITDQHVKELDVLLAKAKKDLSD